jgi:hypothetical protein
MTGSRPLDLTLRLRLPRRPPKRGLPPLVELARCLLGDRMNQCARKQEVAQ